MPLRSQPDSSFYESYCKTPPACAGPPKGQGSQGAPQTTRAGYYTDKTGKRITKAAVKRENIDTSDFPEDDDFPMGKIEDAERAGSMLQERSISDARAVLLGRIQKKNYGFQSDLLRNDMVEAYLDERERLNCISGQLYGCPWQKLYPNLIACKFNGFKAIGELNQHILRNHCLSSEGMPRQLLITKECFKKWNASMSTGGSRNRHNNYNCNDESCSGYSKHKVILIGSPAPWCESCNKKRSEQMDLLSKTCLGHRYEEFYAKSTVAKRKYCHIQSRICSEAEVDALIEKFANNATKYYEIQMGVREGGLAKPHSPSLAQAYEISTQPQLARDTISHSHGNIEQVYGMTWGAGGFDVAAIPKTETSGLLNEVSMPEGGPVYASHQQLGMSVQDITVDQWSFLSNDAISAALTAQDVDAFGGVPQNLSYLPVACNIDSTSGSRFDGMN